MATNILSFYGFVITSAAAELLVRNLCDAFDFDISAQRQTGDSDTSSRGHLVFFEELHPAESSAVCVE